LYSIREGDDRQHEELSIYSCWLADKDDDLALTVPFIDSVQEMSVAQRFPEATRSVTISIELPEAGRLDPVYP
jgi:hypothetical protein